MILKLRVVSSVRSIWKQVRGEQRMRTAQKTDIGRTRVVNEDRAVIVNGAGGITIAIVADGMGGHRAGDTASQITIETLQSELQQLDGGMSGTECEEIIKLAIAKANDKVYQAAMSDEQLHGMGTTVVLSIATEEELRIAHIGDSRAYKVSEGGIVQLTDDHSLVNELVKSGQISAEDALHHPRRNVLTRALGTEKWVLPDIQRFDWQQHDMLLLCSDGLSSHVEPDQINRILCGDADLDKKADDLIQLALEAGGEDNITVILLANDQEDAAVQEE